MSTSGFGNGGASTLLLLCPNERTSRDAATTSVLCQQELDPAVLSWRWLGSRPCSTCSSPRPRPVTVTRRSDRSFNAHHRTKSQPNPEQYSDRRNVKFPLCPGLGSEPSPRQDG